MGAKFQPDCTTECECTEEGDTVCVPQICTYDGPACTVWGDPHYITFDMTSGHRHHFQGTCEYVLSQPCNNEDFVISAKNLGHPWGGVSCVEFVRIKVNGKPEIILRRHNDLGIRGEIIIGGNPVPISHRVDGRIFQDGNLEVIQSGGRPHVFLRPKFRLEWNGIYRVHLTLSSDLSSSLCGLCGTNDGDHINDLRTRQGSVLNDNVIDSDTIINQFGDSWLVPDSCSAERKRRNAPTSLNCSNEPNVTQEAQTRCSVLTQDPFRVCNDLIDPRSIIESCEFDYCCCDETEREDCYCDALSSYASACANAGILVYNWRSEYCCKLLHMYIISIRHYVFFSNL